MTSVLRALIWDMGGVLLRTENHNPRLELGRKYDLTLAELNYLVFGNPIAQLCESGRAAPVERWHFVQRKLGLTEEQLTEFQDMFWGGDHLDESLLHYISSLRPKFKTGLLSNAGPDASASLGKRYPSLLSPFDVVVFSGEIGLVKPDPAIYHHILKALGTAPEEALFIDDFAQNIASARMVGMRAIRFETAEQIRRDLIRHLGE